MISFGWKRKRKLNSTAVSLFSKEKGEEEEKEEGSEYAEDEEVDWLSAARKRRVIMLEDIQTKSKRLQDEGAFLAENQRYWEAIKYWDEAIELTPSSPALHEMKSQVLMELREVFPAVETAEKAVKLDPKWAEAWQTLGRAQIGLGEINMALCSFQKSLHLNPACTEVREDIRWSQELVKQRGSLSEHRHTEEEQKRHTILALRGRETD